MESSDAEMALLALPHEQLQLRLLEDHAYNGPTDLLTERLRTLERFFDREVAAKLSKNLGLLSTEVRTIAAAKATYAAPSLLIKINNLDERVNSLASHFLGVADKLKRDFGDWQKLDQELAALDRQIKVEQLFAKLAESEGKFDYVLIGQ